MKVATIYGGTHGLGLETALQLVTSGYQVDLIGRDFRQAKSVFSELSVQAGRVKFIRHNLVADRLEQLLPQVHSAPDAVFYIAGAGRIEAFSETNPEYIRNCFMINAEVPANLIAHYYPRLLNQSDFFFGCVTSIAGQIVSPLFSVYAASKAAESRLIESVNIELKAAGAVNNITDFCPGNFAGSSFFGDVTDLPRLSNLAAQLIKATFSKVNRFIPNYETVYRSVIEQYHADSEQFGLSSYEFKMKRHKENGE